MSDRRVALTAQGELDLANAVGFGTYAEFVQWKQEKPDEYEQWYQEMKHLAAYEYPGDTNFLVPFDD